MPTVRVATYNLYLGADLSRLFGVADLDELARQVAEVRAQLEATRFEERAAAVAALLVCVHPDLVGLQEVTRWAVAPLLPDGSPGAETMLLDFLPTLLDALEAAGCGYDAHAVNESFAGALPVSDAEWMTLSGANLTLVRRGGPVRVVREESAPYAAGHQIRTGLEGVSFPIVRSWGRVDVEVDGVPLRFVNTHTEAYDAATRDQQRDEVLARNADVRSPVVLVGDLNAEPDVVGMPAPWVDAWTHGVGAGDTCCQAAGLANAHGTLRRRIDYVWLRDAEVLGCRVVGHRPEDRSAPNGLWPSDHACVVADVRLRR